MGDTESSQQGATLLLLWFRLRAEHGADGFIEDGLEALLGEGGALQILDGTNLFRHRQTLSEEKKRQSSLSLKKNRHPIDVGEHFNSVGPSSLWRHYPK